MLVNERRESPDIGVRNCVSIGLQLSQYRIHVARVPEHDRIRELTPRTWGQSLGQCFEEVNRYLTMKPCRIQAIFLILWFIRSRVMLLLSRQFFTPQGIL